MPLESLPTLTIVAIVAWSDGEDNVRLDTADAEIKVLSADNSEL